MWTYPAEQARTRPRPGTCSYHSGHPVGLPGLGRLVRDGLVTRERVAQRDRPDKAVYGLTEAGRQELDRWTADPVARPGGYRDEFFLKLLVASRLGPDRLRQVTGVQRAAYLLVALLVEAAVLHTRANLAVVERAADDADRIASAASQLLAEAAPLPPSSSDAQGGHASSSG